MARKKRTKSPTEPTGDAGDLPLPPGVKLLRTIEAHQKAVLSVAFDPHGRSIRFVSLLPFQESLDEALLDCIQLFVALQYCSSFLIDEEPKQSRLVAIAKISCNSRESGLFSTTGEAIRGVAFNQQNATLDSGGVTRDCRFWWTTPPP